MKNILCTMLIIFLFFILVNCERERINSLDPNANNYIPSDSFGQTNSTVVITIDGKKSINEWDDSTYKIIQFNYISNTLQCNLYMKNDNNNLYIGLEVLNDDYYNSTNQFGQYCDDRLFISFDENNDGIFSDNSEDRLSFFARDGETHSSSGGGDWYWENSILQWEYSKEQNNINDNKYGMVTHTNPIDGNYGNYFFEMKIPFDCNDPYDLQTKLTESVGFCIMYGNPTDGYAFYPNTITSEDNPTNFGVLTFQENGLTKIEE